MARRSKSKRHHFVPQMLLNSFTDDDGWLYVFNSAGAARGILRLRPKQAFAENHLNTAYDLDGCRDYSNEQILSRLEGDSAPIADKIVSAARNLELPALMPEESESGIDSLYASGTAFRICICQKKKWNII